MSIIHNLFAVSLMLVGLNGAYAEEQRCADGQVMVGVKTDGTLICEALINVLLKTDADLLAEKRSALRALMVAKDRASTRKGPREGRARRRAQRRAERKAKAKFKNRVRIKPDREINLHDQLFQEIEDDQTRWISEFRVVPRYKRGELKGFKIIGVRSDSIMRVLGFKSGDVILRVNDHVIDSMERIFNTYQALNGAREIQVDILRRGAPVTLVFHRLNAREWTERYPDSPPTDAQP